MRQPLCIVALLLVLSFRLNTSQSSHDLCITGNDNIVFNGNYAFQQLGKSNSPIYYCSDCRPPVYLYAWTDVSNWLIGEDYRSPSGLSYCVYIATNGIVPEPTECTIWNTWNINTGHMVMGDNIDVSLCPTATVDNIAIVDDICITNNDNTVLDGTYAWVSKLGKSNSSIYYCNECPLPAYLYAWTDTSDWLIGEDYTSSNSFSYCGYIATNGIVPEPTKCTTWNTWDINAGHMVIGDNIHVSLCDTGHCPNPLFVQLLVLTITFQIISKVNPIVLASMIFSFISIIVTLIATILQKRICITQDFNFKICRNRINEIKRYLCRTVLGVNEKFVEIMKTYIGSIQNGLKLHQHAEINAAINYKNLIHDAIGNDSLQNIIQKEWKLAKPQQIGNVSCVFMESNEALKRSIIMSETMSSDALEFTTGKHKEGSKSIEFYM